MAFQYAAQRNFVVNNSQKEDAYKFDKINGKATYLNPKIQTYGASVGLLLQEIFDRKISISDLSHFNLSEWRQAFMLLLTSGEIQPRINEIRHKINEVKNHLIEFGESVEKFDLFTFISQVEKDVNNIS